MLIESSLVSYLTSSKILTAFALLLAEQWAEGKPYDLTILIR
jgi:hypothetical protein